MCNPPTRAFRGACVIQRFSFRIRQRDLCRSIARMLPERLRTAPVICDGIPESRWKPGQSTLTACIYSIHWV